MPRFQLVTVGTATESATVGCEAFDGPRKTGLNSSLLTGSTLMVAGMVTGEPGNKVVGVPVVFPDVCGMGSVVVVVVFVVTDAARATVVRDETVEVCESCSLLVGVIVVEANERVVCGCASARSFPWINCWMEASD